EGAHLQVPDIDSGRMLLHIHGKGGKDRYVPLPDRTLELLREFWKTHRSRSWVFPATTRGLKPGAEVHPLTGSSLHNVFKDALQRAGIAKRAHIHSLRHYAESRTIAELLGDISFKTALDKGFGEMSHEHNSR